MNLTPDQTRASRVFEFALLGSATALLAGAGLLGFGRLIPGGVIGAALAALNVRLTRRITQSYLESPTREKGTASAWLIVKIFCVLACVGVVVYLRPELAPGMALGFTSVLPASLILAANYALKRLE